jgi:hypothetical protein
VRKIYRVVNLAEEIEDSRFSKGLIVELRLDGVASQLKDHRIDGGDVQQRPAT